MNSLFSYRLIVAIGLMAILLLNTQFDFWTSSTHWGWLLALVYLTWICLNRLLTEKGHEKGLPIWIDLIVWSVFFALNQGVSNPLIWCLLLPPLVAAIKQSQLFSWMTTLGANVAYLLWWYLQDQINPHGHHQMMQSHVVGMWLGFIAISLMLTWVVTTLMAQLRQKNEAILTLQQQQTEDFNMVKMATLATSLAHELGSPLHSIKLLVNELSYELKGSVHEKDCEILDNQVRRCKKVLDELTKMTSQKEASAYQEVNLKPYIDDMLTPFRTLHSQIEFHNQLSADTRLMADELLPLVFLNVINNSITAGSKNIYFTDHNNSSSINICIKDDGAGLEHSSPKGFGTGNHPCI